MVYGYVYAEWVIEKEVVTGHEPTQHEKEVVTGHESMQYEKEVVAGHEPTQHEQKRGSGRRSEGRPLFCSCCVGSGYWN